MENGAQAACRSGHGRTERIMIDGRTQNAGSEGDGGENVKGKYSGDVLRPHPKGQQRRSYLETKRGRSLNEAEACRLERVGFVRQR